VCFVNWVVSGIFIIEFSLNANSLGGPQALRRNYACVLTVEFIYNFLFYLCTTDCRFLRLSAARNLFQQAGQELTDFNLYIARLCLFYYFSGASFHFAADTENLQVLIS